MPKYILKRLRELGIIAEKNSSAMLAYWDKDQVCRYANNAYVDWFGVDPKNMIDRITLMQLLGKSLYDENRPYIQRAMKGKVQVFKRKILSPSGKVRNAIATYCPRFEQQEVVGFYVHVEEYLPANSNSARYRKGRQKLPVLKNPIADVEQMLKSSLLTKFPGIPHLAKLHYLSESTLKREFKIRFGKGIFEYYRHLQMELAEIHLKDNLCNQKQVAALLNFSSASNFAACYQKYLKQKATQQRVSEITGANDERYKTFITQIPFAVAMFDNRLFFQAASQKFIDDYRLSDKQLIGSTFYEILPLPKSRWKPILGAALKGKTSNGEEMFFDMIARPAVWVRWDVRPWKSGDGRIGGVLFYTEDITVLKLKEAENEKILEILNNANEMVRIGVWKKNFIKNTGFLSSVTREILEVPDGYRSTGHIALEFYKEGRSRNLMAKVLKEAIEFGTPFDVNAEIVTAKGNVKRVRVVGYAEFKNGSCERLFGVYQELG